MAKSKDTDQTAPLGADCSGSTLFACILNLSVILGNFLQQTHFSRRKKNFLGPLRVKAEKIMTFQYYSFMSS